jgi:hypothetical protein
MTDEQTMAATRGTFPSSLLDGRLVFTPSHQTTCRAKRHSALIRQAIVYVSLIFFIRMALMISILHMASDRSPWILYIPRPITRVRPRPHCQT